VTRLQRRGAVLAALLAIGCGGPEPRRHPLAGVVQDQAGPGAYLVAHDDVPGYMPAMTMVLRVKGAHQPLQKGDRIEATLAVTETESWLQDVRVTASGLPVRDPGAAPPVAGPAPGDLVPDFRLVSQDGRPIRLGQYRGRTLALSFIYTRCPLPDYCPQIMRLFRRLHGALAADPALFARTHLLTVSIDPAYDTPAVMKRYGRLFVPPPGPGRDAHWELATGDGREVRALAASFGVEVQGEGTGLGHNLRTAVIDGEGKLAGLYTGGDWSVDEVLADVRRAAARGN
jgi:protein SCO1